MLITLETPSSSIVTPYRVSAISIVLLLFVIIINCVFTFISFILFPTLLMPLHISFYSASLSPLSLSLSLLLILPYLLPASKETPLWFLSLSSLPLPTYLLLLFLLFSL